jgi:GNAT superfamily N-acetyltransferase
MPRDHLIRQATDADIDELIRLRELMLSSLDFPAGDPSWHDAGARYLRDGFVAGEVVGFVADVDGRVVGGGVGILEHRMPGPGNGLHGYIMSMATDPEHRGQGIAGGVVDALLAWFKERDVRVVDLHASAQGDPVYRARGFAEARYPELRWHL